MLGSPIPYFKGMRILMFQLSGFYCNLLKEPLSKELSNEPLKDPFEETLKP